MGGFGLDGCRALTIREQREHGLSALYEADRFGRSSVVCRVGAQRQLQMVRANRRRGPCGAEPLAPGARKRRSGRNPKRVGAQRQLHMVRGNRRRGPCGAEPLAPGARKRRSGRKPKAGWSADSFIWFVRIGGEARVVPSRLLQEHERDGVDVNPKRVGAQRQIQR